MRSIDFSTLLYRWLQLMGLDRDNITDAQFKQFRDYANGRLQVIWISDYWPDFTRITAYPGATVNQDSEGIRTVTLGSDVGEVLNVYSRDPRVTTRIRGIKYFLYEDSTGRYINSLDSNLTGLDGYDVTATSAGTTAANGTYALTGTTNGKNSYTRGTYTISWSGSVWQLKNGSTVLYSAPIGTNDYPTQLTWSVVNGTAPACSVKPASQVYIEYRITKPEIFGNPYVASQAYSIGAQVYFDTASGTGSLAGQAGKGITGNFYNCIGTTTAGQNPNTNPELWSIVQIPYFCGEYLVRSSYADYLRSANQPENAAAAEALAEQVREAEVDRILRQEGQIRKIQFQTY